MKKFAAALFAVVCLSVFAFAQKIPVDVAVKIVKAEDARRFDRALEDFLSSANGGIRVRAALAAGRIGDRRAIASLAAMLETDASVQARRTAAFALGEIESDEAADAVLKNMANEKTAPDVRARLLEAAGKIAAANQKSERAAALGAAILDVLEAETKKPNPDRTTVLLGLTAILRARPAGGETTAAKFLTSLDWRVRGDAANALSRLRAKNANEPLRAMLLADDDANARANAARALGAAEDPDAFNLLLEAAASDEDQRVRVSAIRALGSLKNPAAAAKLLARGAELSADYRKSKLANPSEKSEILEIAVVLGRLVPNSNDASAVKFLNDFRSADDYDSPEIEVAFAQISPASYLKAAPRSQGKKNNSWRKFVSVAQGLAEFSKLPDKGQSSGSAEYPEGILADFLDIIDAETRAAASAKRPYDIVRAVPDLLRAYAAFKPADLPEILRARLNYEDVLVRAAAAALLSEQPTAKENVEALKTAFARALEKDKIYNDAQLAILSAIVKSDKTQAVSSLKLALAAPDHLVRRHAAALIKQNDLTKDFPNAEAAAAGVNLYDSPTGTKLGQILNTDADYRRAVSRRNARAVLTTDKGVFTVEFFPEDAPLTVANFIKLARTGYYNGLAIHRVVPNFVMQDGDPRGDGNGGPGWSIRCEINFREYERGAIGMALSGKDTGGSQWFAAHAPQPHLDGGYTVFGRVNETGMKIVDRLVRGDVIRSVKIIEGGAPPKNKANGK